MTTGEHWTDRGGFKLHQTVTDLDERDWAILQERQRAFTEAGARGVHSGDIVIFADEVKRYVSHVWEGFTDDYDGKVFPSSVQTSKGGSWYLGNGYCSFSGSLDPGVPAETLTDTGETDIVTVWFFHHDWHKAANGIDVPLTVRVWSCSRRSDER